MIFANCQRLKKSFKLIINTIAKLRKTIVKTSLMSESKIENKNQAEEASTDLYQIEFRKVRLISGILVFVVSFALYFITLAPTVTLVDSGELILAAQTLGVAHPPGFPLYVLLAHLATFLPFGSIAVRIHLASALFAAFASTVMMLTIIEALLMTSYREPKNYSKNTSKKNKIEKGQSWKEVGVNSETEIILIIAPAMIAGLLFAFSRTLWAYATIAEVYTLNSLLIITIFGLMFSWRRNVLEAHADQIEVSNQKLYTAAFVFGLALGVHHVTVGLMLPALAVLVFSTEGVGFFKSKRFIYAALISLASLSIYIYLPLAASHSPLMNWGDPRTLERFWWHITGKQYQSYFNFSLSRISEFVGLVLREFGVVWMPLTVALAVAGFVNLFRRNRTIFTFLLLVIFADVAYCLCYEIAEDKDAYYLPAFIGLIVATGFSIRWLISSLQKTKAQNIFTPNRTAMILMIVPLIALAGNFAYNNHARYFIAHDYIDNILQPIESRGMLLTADWQVYAPSLYVREIENQRTDAVIIDINQMRRSWYFDYLNQSYPDLMEKSRDKVDEFLEDLRAWENNPEAYKTDPLRQRINDRFYKLILSFITNQIKDAPVYITSDIALNRGGQDVELTKTLFENYQLTPQGLVFQVSEKTVPVKLTEPRLVTRGLSDGTLKFDEDDVVKKKIIPVYLNMMMSSGMFFASQGNQEKAISYFKKALAIDPAFEPAQNALATIQNNSQKQGSK